jgi:long-subunit acyl-CoA synthetase (AMP-forming)
MGEYVSLSKVETAMKLNPIVENICVCARSTERATVALVTPDQVGMLVNLTREYLITVRLTSCLTGLETAV